MSEPKQALSSRGVAVVGVNVSEVIKRAAATMVKKDEEARQRFREQESLWKYDTTETIYCVQRLISADKASVTPVYEICSIAPIGDDVVKVRGPREFLKADFRFELAHAYQRAKACKTWDDCRARAAKAEVVFDLMGTK